MRVLMVCLGNICRSPTAEAALREALAEAGLDGAVEVDSAGTGSWHIGDPPDQRMTAAAADVGLELSGAARRVMVADFDRFDLILAMDGSNEADLLELAPDGPSRAKVRRFREFEAAADGPDVPDPYYGGADGFAHVVASARAGARGVVEHIRGTQGVGENALPRRGRGRRRPG
ncbi:MAG: low molecular weight phosphotyrosine protein phosphatase [Euzebyales bacterium]|nr:low molecular weight phosphotyrosine protein phosphatase [Euzebyales bacterium]